MSPILLTTAFTAISFPALADPSQSWINHNALSTDPQTYCSDKTGVNTQNDIESSSQNDIGSQGDYNRNSQSMSSNNIKKGGGNAGIKVGFIKLGGGGERYRQNQQQSASESENSSNATWDRSSQNTSDHSSTTAVVVGKDCDAFVNAAAQVEMNRDQQITNRQIIEAKERTRTREIRSQEQQLIFQNLMNDW